MHTATKPNALGRTLAYLSLLLALCAGALIADGTPALAGAGTNTLWANNNETLYGAQNQSLFSMSSPRFDGAS